MPLLAGVHALSRRSFGGRRGRMSASADPSAIRAALLAVLCHGSPAYTTGYVGWGTPGLFSMMNSVANELLMHVYRGERPQDVRAFYEGTRFLAYGNASLAAHFEPWACDYTPSSSTTTDPRSWAVPALLGAPRYAVASQLVHLIFTPKAAATAAAHLPNAPPPPAERRFALAIHLRRGDKLSEQRNAERIEVWGKERVVAASAKLLDESWRRAKGGAGGRRSISDKAETPITRAPSPTTANVGSPEAEAAVIARVAAAIRAAAPAARPVVLLASDDNRFASTVEAELRSSLGVDVQRPPNDHDRGETAPAEACDEGCIQPLQSLTRQFGRADALMVSSKSNMGSFLITWWGAANGHATPPLVDMDGKLHRAQLQRGRHFCALSWGSRRGMCESNGTAATPGGAAKAASARARLAALHDRTATASAWPHGARPAASQQRRLAEGMCGTGPRANVELALARILCGAGSGGGGGGGGGYAALPPPMTRDGVVGLFSQLNQLAHELLMRAYRGEGPASIHELHKTTRLVGYGGGPLADHFSLGFACPASGSEAAVFTASGGGVPTGAACNLPSHADAVATLKRTPRFLAVGALLHLVLRPLQAPAAHGRFDLAAHIRRGDRIEGWQRTVEKIEVWPADKLLAQLLSLLGDTAAAAAATAAATTVATTVADAALPSAAAGRRPPRVLLASDDNAYLKQLAALGRAAGLEIVLLENPDAQVDGATNRSLEAAKVCGPECAEHALGMLSPFANSDRLVLSSKSNLGGYLLSWWGAANAGQAAPRALFDLDHVLRREALPRRYFCDLPWGTRRGLCAAGQSACDMPQFAARSFCRAQQQAASSGKGKGKGAGGGAKGKGVRMSK